MGKKRAALHNLGCKVNAYEMDVMEQLLIESGYEIVPFREHADVYIINTCTVTNIADRKSRQMLHRARKQNPGAVIVAVGCYVQTADPEVLRKEGIDLCIGNNKKGMIAEILSAYLEEHGDLKASGTTVLNLKKTADSDHLSENLKTEIVIEKDLRGNCGYEDMQLEKIRSHTRAYIKIQDGCNQFCTYCIIPKARGRVRSRAKDEILREVRTLAGNGVREFVLTGIHICSYGVDFREGERTDLADQFYPEAFLDLIRAIAAEEGVLRIRLGSLEPRIMTEDFVRSLHEIEKVCPHFHLSLQSGSDEVLRRMNRHYTAAEYAACVERLRAYYDDPAITTDIIVGFPGETQEEFEESYAFAEKTGFYEIHVFPYSRRKGTPAAAMDGQLTETEKALRVRRMEVLRDRMQLAYQKRHAGKCVEVLFEEQHIWNGVSWQTGQSAEYLHVAVKTEEDLTDKVLHVRLTDQTDAPAAGYIAGVPDILE